MSILEFHKVNKNYRLGDTLIHALRGVDLGIEKGGFIAVLGASGAGRRPF